MSKIVALAGKGGTGKTTIATGLIKYLIERKMGSILAIDADPSSNLNDALGIPLGPTIGDIREGMLRQIGTATGATGIPKQDYLEYEVNMAVVEGDRVDLLAMGRPEGPGCYCAVNNILRLCIDRLGKSYDYVIIDNEAGLEHLSRRTTRDADYLLAVSDPTIRGITTAGRVAEIAEKLKINIGKIYLIVNRVPARAGECHPLDQGLREAIDRLGLELLGVVPQDPTVTEFDTDGRPLIDIPSDSPAYRAIWRIAETILGG
ncbi:MAG: ATP-binding protein [bacterium]